MHELLDIMWLERAASISWLRGDSVDLEVVRDIIAAIIEDIEDLREIYRKAVEEVLNSKLLRKALERTLYTLNRIRVRLLAW